MVYNPASLIAKGSFISTGAAATIEIDPGVDYFYVKNRTKWGSNSNVNVQSEWFKGMSAGAAYGLSQNGGTGALSAVAISSLGFTYVDPDAPVTYAPVALATPFFTQANPSVWTTASAHGLAVGDTVQLYGLTGSAQYAGSFYTVLAVGSNTTFTLNLNTTGITPPSAGFVQKVQPLPFVPHRSVITGVSSSGSSTVISLSSSTSITVGQYVRVYMPSIFGMSSAFNGQLGLVTAVTNSASAISITVAIDSSGYGSFVFPSNSQVPFTFAQVLPVGEVATILTGAESNSLIRGISLGTAIVGSGGSQNTPGDTIDWWAFKADQILIPQGF